MECLADDPPRTTACLSGFPVQRGRCLIAYDEGYFQTLVSRLLFLSQITSFSRLLERRDETGRHHTHLLVRPSQRHCLFTAILPTPPWTASSVVYHSGICKDRDTAGHKVPEYWLD